MKSNETFKNRLVGLQGNLLNFAYQLTSNREQAHDLLQGNLNKELSRKDSALYLFSRRRQMLKIVFLIQF